MRESETMTTMRKISEICHDLNVGLCYSGGATVSPFVGEDAPSVGYMIGGVVEELVLTTHETLRRVGWGHVRHPVLTVPNLHTWLSDIVPNLTFGHYVGAWHDERTGNVHFDVSLLQVSRSHAIRIARHRGELAIYDLAAGETVYVDDMQD